MRLFPCLLTSLDCSFRHGILGSKNQIQAGHIARTDALSLDASTARRSGFIALLHSKLDKASFKD